MPSLELSTQTETTSAPQSPAHLCHPGVKSMHHHDWLKTIVLSVSVVTKQSKTKSRVLGVKEMIQEEGQLLSQHEEWGSSPHLRTSGTASCMSTAVTLGGRDRRVAGACQSPAEEQLGSNMSYVVRDVVSRE